LVDGRLRIPPTPAPDEQLRALEAEVARLREQLAVLLRRPRRRWTRAATKRWFNAGLAAARERDKERHRGNKPKVPMVLIGKLEAAGWQGEALAAEAARLAHADVRTAYRALDRWREFKASGMVFLIELDEQGQLVVTTC
jgi:hypothetical protein